MGATGLFLAGVRGSSAPGDARGRWCARMAMLLCLGGLSGCARQGPPPSIVLVVLDTTRFDAVSAYGRVAGTTPTIDGLARDGLLYEYAYSNANWTLPAHASLFTGLLPSQHGVRIGSDVLGSVPTLAELVRAAGYETVGFSENPWLGATTGTSAGFERFEGGGIGKVDKWLKERRNDRPFFLFLNFMDAHEEYTVRKTNPFLPSGVTAEQAKRVPQKPDHYICATQDKEDDLAILHGLYLGDVQAADAKVAKVVKLLEPLRAAGPVIVVVTSDHGEYFGEQQLAGHIVGLHEAVLRIPLVVNGLPGVASGRLTTPVQLVDLMPSILAWARVPIPAGLAGEGLPTSDAGTKRDRHIVAESYDYLHRPLVAKSDSPTPLSKAEEIRLAALAGIWKHCGPGDRIDGDMRVLIQFPYKLEWYETHSPRLFDLSQDQMQQVDLAAARSDEVTKLQNQLQQIISQGTSPTQPARELDPALLERVRALGYMGDTKASEGGEHVTPAPGH